MSTFCSSNKRLDTDPLGLIDVNTETIDECCARNRELLIRFMFCSVLNSCIVVKPLY